MHTDRVLNAVPMLLSFLPSTTLMWLSPTPYYRWRNRGAGGAKHLVRALSSGAHLAKRAKGHLWGSNTKFSEAKRILKGQDPFKYFSKSFYCFTWIHQSYKNHHDSTDKITVFLCVLHSEATYLISLGLNRSLRVYLFRQAILFAEERPTCPPRECLVQRQVSFCGVNFQFRIYQSQRRCDETIGQWQKCWDRNSWHEFWSFLGGKADSFLWSRFPTCRVVVQSFWMDPVAGSLCGLPSLWAPQVGLTPKIKDFTDP